MALKPYRPFEVLPKCTSEPRKAHPLRFVCSDSEFGCIESFRQFPSLLSKCIPIAGPHEQMENKYFHTWQLGANRKYFAVMVTAKTQDVRTYKQIYIYVYIKISSLIEVFFVIFMIIICQRTRRRHNVATILGERGRSAPRIVLQCGEKYGKNRANKGK